jgi:hypothetical protein
MTLRDGGTTCVTVEDSGIVTHVTVDHRLRRFRWLPRFRFVFTSSVQFGRDRRLLPGGRGEVHYVSEIAHAAVHELGHHVVRDFLAGHGENPGREMWFYVVNFLQIVSRARLRNVLSPPDPP